jgi:hypothetical protein
MKTTLSTSQAVDLLKSDSSALWSRAGAYALVEHLEQLEEDTGTEIEFDVVAIRCDFSEYSSALEAAQDYGFVTEENNTEEEALESEALEWLIDRTQVIQFQGGVIIASF